MRLIDADALRLMKVEECAGHTIEYAAGWKACIEWIKTQSTIDAVPVVRCKDCKFRKDGLPYNADGLFLAVTPPVCGLMTGFIEDDGWCFKGERKDDVEQEGE